MARRLMVILMSAMIMIGFVSCDLSDMMKFMSNNIAGPNPGKINKVDETVDAIWDKEGSNGATQVAPGEDVVIGNINISNWISDDISTYLTPFDDESDFSDLAASISSAASTPQGKDALNASLSKPLDPVKDKDKIDATQGSAKIIKNMIYDAFDSIDDPSWTGGAINDSNIEKYIKEVMAPSEDASDEVYTYYEISKAAILGVVEMTTSDAEISKGDMIIMQTLFTAVSQAGNEFFTGEIDAETGFPGIKEDITPETIDVDKLLTYANGGVKIVDSISASSKFGDISVSSLLSELISSMQESSEGGEN